jgi:hypothetical protein
MKALYAPSKLEDILEWNGPKSKNKRIKLESRHTINHRYNILSIIE